jgi:hypothetical protein
MNDLIIFELIPFRLNLSLILGRPPKIQKIFLLFFNAYFVDAKVVALESLINVIFFFLEILHVCVATP